MTLQISHIFKMVSKIGCFILSLSILASCDVEIPEQEIVYDSLLPLNPQSEYIAVFGDIQYYTQSDPNAEIYRTSVEWLKSQSSKAHFDCILHTGDITQTNSISQYERFRKVTELVAYDVPFFSAIGDHDYSWEDGIHIDNRYSTLFNDYMNFPSSSQILERFEEGRMENIIVKNTICNERYDLLILEFGPRKEVVEWANKYVREHPDVKFILINHEYLEKGGQRRKSALKCRIRLRNTTFTTPEELWNTLIYPNDNIAVVLCGHVGGLYAVTYTSNIKGREVPQIQHNIQSSSYRYGNWIMLWEFQPGNDSTSLMIVNADTQEFYNDSTTLCKFKYRY